MKTETIQNYFSTHPLLAHIPYQLPIMNTAGSYKEKMTRLVAALEQRTNEAKGWKAIADSRLTDLITISEQVKNLETYVITQRSLPWVLSEAPSTMHEEIKDGPPVRSGVSAVEDVFDQLKIITAAFHRTTMEGVDIVTEATSRLSEGVGMPNMEELEGCEGLSLAEMGGPRRDTPPSPPRSASPIPLEEPMVPDQSPKSKLPGKPTSPKATKDTKQDKDKKKRG